MLHADESLKKDKEVVLEAIKNNCYSIQYADESLKKDKEVAMTAIKKNSYWLRAPGNRTLHYYFINMTDKKILIIAFSINLMMLTLNII